MMTTKMIFLFFLLFLLSNVFTGSRAQLETQGNDCTTTAASRWKRDGTPLCPSKDEIAPCVCNANYNTVTCRDVDSDDKLGQIFNGFPDGRITKVEITSSNVVKLSSGVFGKMRIHDIEIRENTLETVEANAFAGSEFTVLYINLNHNRLKNFSFQSIQSIVKLRQLQLAYNQLTEIPDNAFGSSLTKLDFLALNNNRITKIGQYAFKHLDSLSFLDLSHNYLMELGPHTMSFSPKMEKTLSVVLNRNNISIVHENAFEGKNPTFLALIKNNLKTLDEKTFKPILNSMVESTTVVGLAVQGNPIVCDCHVKWMLDIPEVNNVTLRQFECNDGRVLANLTEGSLECL